MPKVPFCQFCYDAGRYLEDSHRESMKLAIECEKAAQERMAKAADQQSNTEEER